MLHRSHRVWYQVLPHECVHVDFTQMPSSCRCPLNLRPWLFCSVPRRFAAFLLGSSKFNIRASHFNAHCRRHNPPHPSICVSTPFTCHLCTPFCWCVSLLRMRARCYDGSVRTIGIPQPLVLFPPSPICRFLLFFYIIFSVSENFFRLLQFFVEHATEGSCEPNSLMCLVSPYVSWVFFTFSLVLFLSGGFFPIWQIFKNCLRQKFDVKRFFFFLFHLCDIFILNFFVENFQIMYLRCKWLFGYEKMVMVVKREPFQVCFSLILTKEKI